MNWFTEIFSSTSDQARLATTIIAAVIAIFVVFINQSFNSRRTRNEKTIEKIEEIYTSIIKLEELSSETHLKIITNYGVSEVTDIEESIIDQLKKEFLRTEATAYMLSGLYFPHLKKDIKKLKNIYQSLYISYVTSESLPEYCEFQKEHSPMFDNTLNNIYINLSAIMNKQMYNKAFKRDN